VGPNLRLRGQTLAFDIHGGAVLALLRVMGVGLTETSSDTGAQVLSTSAQTDPIAERALHGRATSRAKSGDWEGARGDF
jgi:hypothetical protein